MPRIWTTESHGRPPAAFQASRQDQADLKPAAARISAADPPVPPASRTGAPVGLPPWQTKPSTRQSPGSFRHPAPDTSRACCSGEDPLPELNERPHDAPTSTTRQRSQPPTAAADAKVSPPNCRGGLSRTATATTSPSRALPAAGTRTTVTCPGTWPTRCGCRPRPTKRRATPPE